MRRGRLELDAAPDAALRARRFVSEQLAAWALADLAPDAELAVTELVTNAVLHGGPPIAVTVASDGTLRIEVYDSSPILPMRARVSDEAMTGRGLLLIEALSQRWGVQRTPAGKAVWCELPASGATPAQEGWPDGDADVALLTDVVLDGWPETHEVTEAEPARVFTVSLGDVPTDLLLAAKGHVDNIVREFALVASRGAFEIPAHIAALVEGVVSDFAEARNAIKRQAVAAAARGDARTRLELSLPARAADDGERYLKALDKADAYARAARLLTLESPPQHRVFRRWYVESIVSQLRRAAAGLPTEPPPTFEQYLLGEVDAIVAARRATDRSARLQRATAALATASTPAEVADVLVTQATAALGAYAAVLLLVQDGQTAGVAGQTGYGEALLRLLRTASTEMPMPITTVISTNEPVWIESGEERDLRFSRLSEIEPDTVSLCAVPLVLGKEVIAVLRCSFSEPHLFDSEEREFVHALTAQAAQTLERAKLYDTQAKLTDRLTRMQSIMTALARTQDVADVTRVVIEQAAAVLGIEDGAMCLLSDHGEELEVVAYYTPRHGPLTRWRRFPVYARLPAADAARTGRPVLLGSLAERDARYPALAGLPPRREHALACLPLVVDGRSVGVLSLSLPGAGSIDDDELAFLGALAGACGQFLARARQAEAARAERDRLAYLADASAELGASLDQPRVVAALTRRAVPRLGDWCAVYTVTDGQVTLRAVTHADPKQAADLHESLARLGAPGAVLAATRTGDTGRYEVIAEHLLAPQRRPDAVLASGLGTGPGLVVPLAADRVVGVLAVGRSGTDRPYDAGEVALAEDLSRRAATALANALRYADRPP